MSPSVDRAAEGDFSDILQPLLARSRGALRAELEALAQESDPTLLFEGLLAVGVRQEQEGAAEFAAEVYAGVAAAGSRAGSMLQARAQQRLDAVLGRGAAGARFEFLARHFAREAADPTTLVAMTAGSLVFTTVRGAFLSRLLTSPSANFFTRGLGARALASSGAFFAEVPAFWATGKGLREVVAPGSQSWDAATNLRELAGAGLTLGALKLSGFAAQSLYQRVQGRVALGASAHSPLQTLFTQTGMLGGIMLGHRLEETAGLRRPVDGATTLVDSLVMLLQFHVGGRLSSGLLGEGWARRVQELETRLDRLEPPASAGREIFASNLALATAGSGRGPAGREVASPENLAARPMLMIAEGEGGGRGRGSAAWRAWFGEVMERGRSHELMRLRDMIRELLNGDVGRPYARLSEKLASRDPEEWRTAIKILGEMIEKHPRLLEQLSGFEPLGAFRSDWDSRPHFASAQQVPYVVERGTTKMLHLQQHMMPVLLRTMAENPSLRGWEAFATQRVGRKEMTRVETRVDESGAHRVFANWKHVGVEIHFDRNGYLEGEIRVRPAFSEQEWEQLGRPKPVETEIAAPAPRVSGKFAPQRGENLSEWALRLLESSRGSEENSLAIAQTLAERLENPDTAADTRDMVERLVSLTATLPERQGILARKISVAGVRDPLTIISLPTTFLPEQWSRVFAEGVVHDYRSHRRPVGRAVEIGSGTGFVSILLAKFGIAREVIGLDVNPHAPVVGRLNAALNGVAGVSFRESNLMSELPPEYRADLIVACIPQVPSQEGITSLRASADYYASEGGYWDRYGLGLIDRALGQARDRLAPGGRVLLNLGGRPGREILMDLFQRRGFHPAVRYGQLIPQDPTTDFSALARLEVENRHRFEFFTTDDPNTPISAGEAVGRGEVFHMLYLTEGRLYSDRLRQAVADGSEGVRRWGYTQDPGSENEALRTALAQGLSLDWGKRMPPDLLFLGPSSDAILEGLLRVTLPESGRVLYAGPTEPEMPAGLRGFDVEAKRPDWTELREAIEAQPPQAVVLRMPPEAWDGPGEFGPLLDAATAKGAHVIVLEDHPIHAPGVAHPLAEFLSNHPHAAPFVHVVQSLDRRYEAPALPLGVALIGNSALHDLMGRYGDITYSRASSLIQAGYQKFFEELPRGILPPPEPEGMLEPMLTTFDQDSPVLRVLHSRAAFESAPRGEHPDPIDMSFGESEWPGAPRVPLRLESAWSRPPRELETDATQAVLDYLWQSRGVRFAPQQVVLGAGVHPLLGSAIRGISRVEGGRALQVAVPRPSYGLFFPTVELAGARPLDLMTSSEDRFLAKPGMITWQMNGRNALSRTVPALLINEPTNPAGQYYGEAAVSDLVASLKRQRAWLLFDDVFGMLDFGRSRRRRSPTMQVLQQEMGSHWVGFGGLSKEFAAGGLRFGFAVSPHPGLAEAMRHSLLAAPDPLALAAAPEYLRRWQDIVPPHRQYLSANAAALERVFRERHLPVTEAQGGYALFADLRPLFGRRLRLRQGGHAELNALNLHQLLYQEAGIKVHGEEWAGVRGHYRFVFSIERLDEAIERLKMFFRSAR